MEIKDDGTSDKLTWKNLEYVQQLSQNRKIQPVLESQKVTWSFTGMPIG